MAIDDTFLEALKEPFPDKRQLRSMPRVNYLSTLERYDLMDPFVVQQSQATAAATALTNAQPGSPRFRTGVSALISREAKTAIKGLAIGAARQYTVVQSLKGDITSDFIWIVEGDENTCDNCRENAGLIMTYEEWSHRGLPGPPTCLGLERCRCDLFELKQSEMLSLASEKQLERIGVERKDDPGKTAINKALEIAKKRGDSPADIKFMKERLVERLRVAREREAKERAAAIAADKRKKGG
jgi:hypothetical protein